MSNRLLLDVSVAGVCVAAIVTQWLMKRRSQLPLPPGPDRLPLIGNLLQMPKSEDWITYHEWCEKLGTDILHFDAAGTSLIILDTANVANELLEKRSSNYSDRMHLTMVVDLMGWNFLLGFLPYGNVWRRRRKLMHQSFHPEAATKFHAYELKATHGLLRRILNGSGPTDVLREVRQMSGETIMKVTYGLDVREKNDPFIEAADKAMETISYAAVPGAFLVDAIPALKYVPAWVPGAGFQRKAREWKKTAEYMVSLPFESAKAKAQAGDEPYSFMSHALQQKDPHGDPQEHEYDVQGATGTMYAAGMDTTVSVITTTLLGLLEHPDVVAKARRQIDEVVGTDRLPSFEDYNRLPYLTAIVKEGLRWRTTTPIAIPHMANEEDEFNGYRIPKGAILIPNAWAMLHDPKHYPDPWDFKPERFLNQDGEIDPTVKDPAHAAFGFGRRICSGRYFAVDAVWIALASLIAAYDISKTVDENGKEIPLTHKYRTGMVNTPEPYQCVFKIRSKEAEALVNATTSQTYY